MNKFELEKSHKNTAIFFAEWLSLNWYRYSLKKEMWLNDLNEESNIDELYLKFLKRYEQ